MYMCTRTYVCMQVFNSNLAKIEYKSQIEIF